MGTTPLYAVDPSGSVTPPSDPPFEGSGRAKPKSRPSFATPTDRLRFERQDEALRVVCVKSRNGDDEVTADDMAAAMGISKATAPLNNAFFIDVNLMTRASKAGYKPTPIALEYQRKWSFDRKAAGPVLAPAFKDAWFLKAVREQLDIQPETTRNQMIEVLAHTAGTDNSYSTQYGSCLDWLVYVGLLREDGGFLRLVSQEPAPSTEPPAEPDAPADPVEPTEPAGEIPADPTPQQERPPAASGVPVIAVSVAINLTAEDLAKLGADEIKALFHGAAEIAAVNAKLG